MANGFCKGIGKFNQIIFAPEIFYQFVFDRLLTLNKPI